MNEKIKYGMVGGSLDAFIGEVHRKALAFDPRVSLVAGCFSSNYEKNEITGRTYGLSDDRIYPNYKEMASIEASKKDGIDFVVITTPNYTHYDIAKEFLENGIHVMCEKPLCFEIDQAEELKKISAEKGLYFGVAHAYTGYTMTKVVKEMIANGKIGNLLSVNAEYIQDWLLGSLTEEEKDTSHTGIAGWRNDPKFSGISNAVGDIGTHAQNMVEYMTGLKISRLVATMNTYGKQLEMNANIIVEYDNGINGAYWISQIAAGKLNGLAVRIYGDKGSIEWYQEHPDYVNYSPLDGPTEILSRGRSYVAEKAGTTSRLPTGHPEGYYIGFANIYRNFVNTIEKHKNVEQPNSIDLDFPTVEDGLTGVKFIHAVIKSAENNSSWVELD